MKRYFCFFLLLISPAVRAQSNLQRIVDSLAHAYLKNHAGALAIGIHDNGKEKIFYYGETEKGSRQRPDSNSIFELGGLSETFTSVLYAELSIKGAVGIDDPLQYYLPVDVPSPVYRQMVCKPVENTTEPARDARVEELNKIFFTPYVCLPDSGSNPQPILLCYLSTHTSGLPEYPDNLQKNKENPYAGYTKDMLYDFLRTYNAEQPIGFDYRHSDLGIALLGHALSLRLNKSYDSLLTERIFTRLNMFNTDINLSTVQQKHFLNGHDESGKLAPHWTYDILAPAGALHSTPGDMMRFLAANISTGNPARVGSFKDVLDFTHNPRIKLFGEESGSLEIALGWKISPSDAEGKNIVWQNGHTGGFASYIGFIEINHTGVVVLSSVSKNVDQIGKQIIESLNKERLQ